MPRKLPLTVRKGQKNHKLCVPKIIVDIDSTLLAKSETLGFTKINQRPQFVQLSDSGKGGSLF